MIETKVHSTQKKKIKSNRKKKVINPNSGKKAINTFFLQVDKKNCFQLEQKKKKHINPNELI